MDRLEEMLRMQEALQRRYNGGRSPRELTPEEKVEFIRTMMLATTDELHEALRETAWKPWSKRDEWTSEENDRFKDELIDAWHFMMNLVLVSGMGADEFFERYLRKNGINHDREDNGYISPTG